MLQVLWLARSLPVPLNAGDRIYTNKLVSAVARAGARVTYVGHAEHPAMGSDRDLDPQVNWITVPGPLRSTVASVLRPGPLVAERHGTPAYRRVLRRHLARHAPDLIVIDHYGLVFALDEICASGFRGIMLHIAHDFETAVTRDIARAYRGNPMHRTALHLNALKTARSERRLAEACDLVVTLTDEDGESFRAIGARKLLTVPPAYDGRIASSDVKFCDRPRRVAIVGSFRWTAKQLNLTRFLERADAVLADQGIQVDLVGDVPDELRHSLEPRVRATRFLGFVDDLATVFDSVRMGMIIEETGGGFKLKALDYIFNRLPVAALTGSFRGLPESVTRHFVVSESPDGLAKAVSTTIDDFARLESMQASAFDQAEGYFGWDRSAVALLTVVEELCRVRADWITGNLSATVHGYRDTRPCKPRNLEAN